MKRIVLLLSFAFCLTSTKSQIKTTYSNQKIKIEHIASGTKLITKNVTGTSAVVATGKSRGVFVVRATIGKEVLSEKVVLK